MFLFVISSLVLGSLMQAGSAGPTLGPTTISFIFHIFLLVSLKLAPVSVIFNSSSRCSLKISSASFLGLGLCLEVLLGFIQVVPKLSFCNLSSIRKIFFSCIYSSLASVSYFQCALLSVLLLFPYVFWYYLCGSLCVVCHPDFF